MLVYSIFCCISTGNCESLDPANPLTPDRILRIRVPLDQCMPFNGNSYEYKLS